MTKTPIFNSDISSFYTIRNQWAGTIAPIPGISSAVADSSVATCLHDYILLLLLLEHAISDLQPSTDT